MFFFFKWRQVESRQATAKTLRPNHNLPEWQDVSMVKHVLPLKQQERSNKQPIEFGLATERRVKERENWEQNKMAKERYEKEIREMENLKEREREREELVQLRRERIVKANPVPDYLKRLP